MDKVRLTNVAYVHAAPQECKSGARIPPMYKTGDVVIIDRERLPSVTVELQVVDEGKGYFEGRVVDATADGLQVGTEVMFEFR